MTLNNYISKLNALTMNNDIQLRLMQLRQRVSVAELAAGFTPGRVQILAVSKQQSAEKIRAAFAADQRAFGENYLQEALSKMSVLADLSIEWHFIGAIQLRKCAAIAKHFAWVHSVDRIMVAEKLSRARPADLPPLNICIQVNIAAEPTKAGIGLDNITELASQIASLPRLRLRGLMTIPEPSTDMTVQKNRFSQLASALQKLIQQGFEVDTLSMGMSDDFEAAIAAGATWIRIGTAIFDGRELICP